MEKLNFNVNDDFDFQEYIKEIKNNNLISPIIASLKITDDEIETYYELFNYYLNINNKCFSCQSKNECNHSTKGLMYQIKRDSYNQLSDSFIICKYFKDYYVRKNNLLYTTFDKEEILDDSQKNFVYDNIALLGKDFTKRIISLLKGEKISGAFLQLKNAKIRLKLLKSLSYGLLLKYKVSIVKLSDLLKEIKSDFKTNDKEDTFKIVLESDILIIDGLGNEAISAWSRDEILLSLIDNRLQSEKTTILCSEFSLEELPKIYKLNYNDDTKANHLIEKINEIKM